MTSKIVDLFVIGGGINGVGVARDAAGRGLSVTLAEMNDLASATSSQSTKLFHGGLRYLEFFEFGLVRKALIEREVLLKNMPHISWPMRFVLPLSKDMRFENATPTSRMLGAVMPWLSGRRPNWIIRLGLFLYDTLGGREILPATRSVNLAKDDAGTVLNAKFQKAFEYSDCWVDDARLVVLNARNAEIKGATILPHNKVVSAERHSDHWVIKTQKDGQTTEHRARVIVNAAGPWIKDVLTETLRQNTEESVRLVRGSHIVTRRLFENDQAYFFQGEDGRIIFAIPYEQEFTLIGTTDQDHPDPTVVPVCTPEEQDYLCAFASNYFKKPVTRDDIVWTYSGVRPLYDDGADSATAATREYVLTLDENAAPLLNIFGGKITTYRKLAEQVLTKLENHLDVAGKEWTQNASLPGGDFKVAAVTDKINELRDDFPFLDGAWAQRLFRAYGLDAWLVLLLAQTKDDLGTYFGANLYESEVIWLINNEYARTADDVLWRRSKLGLRLDSSQVEALDIWMTNHLKDDA
ncbi:MAG: glycerol-3-phosphate dehydrogenase [Paracoccaceae bacterium]|nr:glycerol-3-phosphate dehydrogenase [Paracoccaceae bacterium]